MRKHLHPHVKLILPTICMLDRTSQKLRLQVHGIERVDGLVIVGLDLTCETKLHQLSFFRLCRTTSGGVLLQDVLSSHLLGSPRDPYQRKP